MSSFTHYINTLHNNYIIIKKLRSLFFKLSLEKGSFITPFYYFYYLIDFTIEYLNYVNPINLTLI